MFTDSICLYIRGMFDRLESMFLNNIILPASEAQHCSIGEWQILELDRLDACKVIFDGVLKTA